MRLSLLIISVFAFTFTIWPMAYSSSVGHIDPNLATIMSQNQDQPIGLIIFLKDKVNVAKFRGHSGDLSRALRQKAHISQSSLLEFIDSLPQDRVKGVESLWATNGIILSAYPEIIQLLSERPEIEVILHDSVLRLPDFKMEKPEIPNDATPVWSLTKVQAPRVWKEFGLTGKGIIVGHLDTGVDGNHPDLADKIVDFRDFTKGGAQVKAFDDQGHGTHTAGTICGGSASGSAIGIAPNVRLMVAKIFTASGSTQSSWILKAMQWILDPDGDPTTDDAPRIVSNSWGSNDTSNTYYWDIVQAWQSAGMVPFFSAGNNGYAGDSTCGTPSNFPHSFAIGATDKNDKLAAFSSKGPIVWKGKSLIKPDISAPGEGITSAKFGGGWVSMNGTSMACPNAAGIAALMLEGDPQLKAQDIMAIQEATSLDLGVSGKDNHFGWGRVDAYKSVNFVKNGGRLAISVKGIGQALKNASITIEETGTKAIIPQDGGSYEFLLSPGNYTVLATATGFIPITEKITVNPKQITKVNLSLPQALKVKISGKVTDEKGKLISAKISVGPDFPSANTDSWGQYSMTLPSGIWELSASSFGYATKNHKIILDSSPVNQDFQLTKLPPILLVDDDKGKDYEKYFIQALDHNNFAYNTTTNPTLEMICQYPIILWLTGDDSSTALTKEEREMLEKYLDSGGSLLISGQDLGYNIKNEAFYAQRLCAQYVKDTADSRDIKGTHQIFPTLSANLTGGDGANNQRYPDVIKMVNHGISCINYGDGSTAGILSENKGSKVIYLSFGFEGINSAGQRNQLINDAISWLYQGPHDLLQRTLQALDKNEKDGDKLEYALERIVALITESLNKKDTPAINGWAYAIRNLSDEESLELRHLLRGLGQWAASNLNNYRDSEHNALANLWREALSR